MAGRKKKNTVDYFPHYIGEGKKIQYIEAKYGNDGYATWFKILEALATTPNHFIDLNSEIETVFLAQKCKVKDDMMLSIINDLAMLGSINKKLWERRIIWSEIFIDSIKDAYKKRATFSLNFDDLYAHIFGAEIPQKIKSDAEIQNNCISGAEIDKSDAEIDISGGINRERRKKKEEIKKEEKRNIPTEVKVPTPSVDSGTKNVLPKLPWEQYSALDFETPKTDLLADVEFVGRMASNNVITEQKAIEWIGKFFSHIETTKEGHTNLIGYRKHCANWINLRIANQQNNEKSKTSTRRHEAGRPANGYGKL